MPVTLWEFSRKLEPQEVIWRYMSNTAALNTLMTSKLRFTQLRILSDHWEGAITPATITSYKQVMDGIAEHFGREIPDQEESLRVLQLLNRFHNYVCCWTTNPPDQMQMWDAFSDSNEWCAIKTTVSKLKDSLSYVPAISDIGAIAYVDPDNEPIHGIDIRREIYRKRDSFKHENEIRFTINTTHENKDREKLFLEEPPYLFETFNTDIFEAIVVHPRAPIDTEIALKNLLGNSGFDIDVSRSSIAETPPYLDFRN